MKKMLKGLLIFILSYLTTISIAGVSGFGITGIEIILPCIFALAVVVYVKACSISITKRDICFSAPVGVIFSASVVVGSHYDMWDEIITSFGVKDILFFLMLSLFFIAAVLILFSWLDKLASKKIDGDRLDSKDNEVSARQSLGIDCFSSRKKYWLGVLILIICWMPYYLTMLPGNLGKDTFESIDMCLGNIPWTNHHPIFFTALINIVLKLTSFVGSVIFGMAVFTLLHMFAVACTLSFIVTWLEKKVGYKGYIALLFFALNPIVAMYSIYISKDVLFSCALVLFVLKLMDMHGDFSNIRDCLALGLWALLSMLLRNNGLLIMCLMAVILLGVYRKSWKNTLIATVLPIVIFMIFRSSAYNILSIQPESFAESASVPLQQIGYVISESEGRSFDVTNGSPHRITGLDEEDIRFLKELMPFERVFEVYTLGYTDSYKFDSQFNDELLNKNVGRFMGIWFKALPGNFASYIKAYLAQTCGYWHYGETNTLCTQGVWENNTVGVARIDVIENITGFSLYGIIEKLMLVMRKAPLLCILSSMAMQLYALLLLISVCARKTKNRDEILAILPLLLLWISIMIASPASCLFRYTYPLYIMWPIMITGIVNSGIDK